MRLPRRFALLLAVPSAIAAGCSGGGGDDDDGDSLVAIDVTVVCSGPACGLTGSLKVPLHEDTCGASALLTVSVPAVTLSTGAEETVALDGLEPGAYCVEAWLDVDTSGSLSSGDAIASGGGQTETPASNGGELSFTLDTLQP